MLLDSLGREVEAEWLLNAVACCERCWVSDEEEEEEEEEEDDDVGDECECECECVRVGGF